MPEPSIRKRKVQLSEMSKNESHKTVRSFTFNVLLLAELVFQVVAQEKPQNYSKIIYAICLFAIAALIYQVPVSRLI